MFTYPELLDMVATEAIEAIILRDPFSNISSRPYQEIDEQSINYDLCLVYYPDGRLEWKD